MGIAQSSLLGAVGTATAGITAGIGIAKQDELVKGQKSISAEIGNIQKMNDITARTKALSEELIAYSALTKNKDARNARIQEVMNRWNSMMEETKQSEESNNGRKNTTIKPIIPSRY